MRTNKNALILDCYSGSGTTAIACHNTGRNFICFEKDPDYFKASVKRYEDEKRQMKFIEDVEEISYEQMRMGDF